MVKRFIGFVVVATLLVGFGYVFFLNPETVVFRLTREIALPETPLPLLLLIAFLLGALLMFLLALVRETQWTVSTTLERLRRRRQERRQLTLETARHLHWKGFADEAGETLRRARRPEVAETLELAAAKLDSGDATEARSILEKARSRHPENTEVLELLARAYARLGEQRTAVVTLEQAVVIEPRNPRLLAAVRSAHVREGRWEEARDVQERLVDLLRDPSAVEREQAILLGLRYEAARALPDEAEALRRLERITHAHPDFLPAAVSLGDTLWRSGRAREAEKVWLRALRRKTHPVLLDRLENAYRESAQPDRAASLYRRLLRQEPSPMLRLRLGRVLLGLADVDGSIRELEVENGNDALVPERSFLLGEAYRRAGKEQQALRAFRKGFEVHARRSPPFVCASCGRSFATWSSRCPGCGEWDRLEPGTEPPMA